MLGTGTSHGVPMIGCECATCRSTDPRDRRSRASILIQIPGGPSVLIDTTPDLRSQALAHSVKRVDAISTRTATPITSWAWTKCGASTCCRSRRFPVTATSGRSSDLRRIYSYIFDPDTPRGGGVPQVVAVARRRGSSAIGAATFVPVPLLHGSRHDPRLSRRLVRVSDRLQRDSGGVVAAAAAACAR